VQNKRALKLSEIINKIRTANDGASRNNIHCLIFELTRKGVKICESRITTAFNKAQLMPINREYPYASHFKNLNYL